MEGVGPAPTLEYDHKALVVAIVIASTTSGFRVVLEGMSTTGESVATMLDDHDIEAIANAARVIRAGTLADA
jgi:hypothetical protein